MRFPLLLLVIIFTTNIYGQCVDPNSTAVSFPVYLATDKSGFDENSNFQLAFEWEPVNTRIITDISLDGDSNCSHYGIISNWTYYLDSTSSCNNGIQATFNWGDLYYSCPDSFTTLVLPTLQKILLSFTITLQEDVNTPTGSVTRTIINQVPFEIDLPTTATLSFGPFYAVPQNVGVRVIIRLAGSLDNFDSVGFAQAISNFTQISAWRIVLVSSAKRDFDSEVLIQPGPEEEPTADAAAQTFQDGVNDGSFNTQSGFTVSSILVQDYSIQGVITDYASTNNSLYQIHFRTFVANFPSPAGITADDISFSGTLSSIQIVETSNAVNGDYYVQDWDIFIVPGASCFVRGTVSINFNFTGANPSTVTVAQITIDSTSTCPSVINPTTLIGTVYAYTDLTLSTKASNFRQHDSVYFQAKITNNKLPIQDDGLTITKIEYQLGSNPVQTLVNEGSSNITDLGYETLSSDSSVIAWMTVSPDAFPVADQYSIFSFYFYLSIAYESNKRDQPLTDAVATTRLIFQLNTVNTPVTSQKAEIPNSSVSSKQVVLIGGLTLLFLLL